MQPNKITEVLNRPISQELLARDMTRLAYVAKDGTPRNVPIIFTWNGAEIVMCTPKNAPKLRALGENPMVALTIDTEVLRRRHPVRVPASNEHLRDDARTAGRVGGGGAFAVPRRHGPDRRGPDRGEADRLETTLPSAVAELVRRGSERATAEQRAVARIGWITHALHLAPDQRSRQEEPRSRRRRLDPCRPAP